MKVAHVPAPIAENWQWQEQGAAGTWARHGSCMLRGSAARRRVELERHAKGVRPTCRCCAPAVSPLTVPEPYRVWGGLSETERQQILNEHSEAGPAEHRQRPPRRRRDVFRAVACSGGETGCAGDEVHDWRCPPAAVSVVENMRR